MKIRTRAFLLGLFPTLLVAGVLTAFHIHTRLSDLETSVTERGNSLARHLASAAEYGVISGNRAALTRLLDQALSEPGVESVAVVWPDQSRLVRGEDIGLLRPIHQLGQRDIGKRSWFVYPVQLNALEGKGAFFAEPAGDQGALAWVAIGLDLEEMQAHARELLLASLGITLFGMALAVLLIHRLALSGLKPLLDIIGTVKHISHGSFGSHMDVTARSPELRELQTSVNQMSQSLHSYQQDMEAQVRTVTAELEYKKKEAEQASLAKSRFLASASHDLRQPMHAISLYVESLKPQMRGRAAEEILNKIERSVGSMVELFNAILDVTKLDAGVVQPHLSPLRIRMLLRTLAEEFAADAERRNLSLRVRVPDVWIESDPILLERILRNLLSNALRNTRQGGVLLSGRFHQRQLRLQVWDTGCGIAPEHQVHIFEEFYQPGGRPTQTRQGLGLGLAIVRRLTRLLGHPLLLHSRPGQGTVFALDVPLAAPQSAPDGEHEEADCVLQGNAVVVDDDPAILHALEHLLRQWGMNVQGLHTLDEVVHEIQFRPDVVLADYQLLKGETGLMVAQAVHQRWGAYVPVVLITGDTRKETIEILQESGFPVLHKPVRAQQLRTTLGMLLQGRHVCPAET